MLKFQTLGGKIVGHFFSTLDPFYFNNNFDYPEVIKNAFEKFDKNKEIYLVKNSKGQIKVSSSSKYGTVVLSYQEILKIIQDEINQERPKLSLLIEKFNQNINNL